MTIPGMVSWLEWIWHGSSIMLNKDNDKTALLHIIIRCR